MVTSTVVSNVSEVFSLEDYMLNPPEHMEWVDGQLLKLPAHKGTGILSSQGVQRLYPH